MNARNIAFVTPAGAPGWKRWLVFSPLARIVIFVVLTWIVGIAISDVLHLLLPAAPLMNAAADHSLSASAAGATMRVVPVLLAYLLLVHFIERRRVAELSWRTLVPQASAGIVLGIVLFSTVVGILWLAGSYHLAGTNSDVHWLAAILVLGLGAGIGEEIMFRGVLFRIVEEGLGTWAALLVSALAFGAIHLGNPNATLWSGLAIAIEAGILFGLIYHVTRSLWICMGLHAAWNVMQGPFYGISVSGLKQHGWLQSSLTGPDWLTGGPFGAEASVVALGCCTALSIVFLMIALRRGSIVPPSWRRRDTAAVVATPYVAG
jgi:membrane protease YdiL (CAAX protease family)